MSAVPLTPRSVPPVPVEYGGKWVAWSADHSRVLAHSERFEELWRLINEQQIPDPVFEKVPRSDVRLVGRQ